MRQLKAASQSNSHVPAGSFLAAPPSLYSESSVLRPKSYGALLLACLLLSQRSRSEDLRRHPLQVRLLVCVLHLR